MARRIFTSIVALFVLTGILSSCGGSSDSLSQEDQQLVISLAATIASADDFDGTADAAECMAESMVTALGASYIRDNNLTDSDTYVEWDPFEAGLSRDKFKKVFKGTFECADGQISTLLGEDTEQFSEETLECILDLFTSDDYLDTLYDLGEDFDDDEPPMEFIESLIGCPSFIVDSFVAGGVNRKDAECLADKVGADFIMFSVEAANLPGDEMPEGSTEFLAELFSASAECGINIEDVFQ